MGVLDPEFAGKKEESKVDIASAGIGAAGSLFGGLFDAAAKKKAQERQAAAEALQSANKAEGAAAQGLSEGQSKAFGSLMDAWKSALLR